ARGSRKRVSGLLRASETGFHTGQWNRTTKPAPLWMPALPEAYLRASHAGARASLARLAYLRALSLATRPARADSARAGLPPGLMTYRERKPFRAGRRTPYRGPK